MRLRLNKAHFPVTVLGFGRRIGLWFQGCGIQCPGCVSQDTWDTEGGSTTTVEDVLNWCRDHEEADGVTISGGEPFDQADALEQLLDGILEWRGFTGRQLDVLCYSGYPLRVLNRRHRAITRKLDVLIPEPYRVARPSRTALTGSSNQRVICLTTLGRDRYIRGAGQPGKRLQLSVQDGSVWLIGIPGPGDLDAMERRCAEKGLLLRQLSWRT